MQVARDSLSLRRLVEMPDRRLLSRDERQGSADQERFERDDVRHHAGRPEQPPFHEDQQNDGGVDGSGSGEAPAHRQRCEARDQDEVGNAALSIGREGRGQNGHRDR